MAKKNNDNKSDNDDGDDDDENDDDDVIDGNILQDYFHVFRKQLGAVLIDRQRERINSFFPVSSACRKSLHLYANIA